MCGIAGAIGYIDLAMQRGVAAMSDHLRHRGPDDHGAWQSDMAGGDAGRGALLAFRRLAIIDLSPAAHQPMIDPANGNVLIFNGEIYNHHELRVLLECRGHCFRSTSDTEVLLKSYGEWGADCLQHLRGMFAFALWDQSLGRVMLARDRLGIKPLYFCTINQADGSRTLLFASEMRALLNSGLIERRMNVGGLESFVWNGFVVGPQTIIERIQILPAGTWTHVHCDGLIHDPKRYWRLPDSGHATEDGVDHLREILSEAVRQHLISDVPLGVFLSGGIDSSAVTALAARAAPDVLRTFNISFDELEFDESSHARKVARALHTEHQEVRLTQDFFRAHLDEALDSLDQPTFDAINTYFVSRAVREAGMTVALAGTGGDELFGGYRSFVDLPRAALASAAVRGARPVIQAAATAYGGLATAVRRNIARQTRWGKLGDVLSARGRLTDLYQISYALFTRDFLDQLLASNGDVPSGLPSQRHDELSALIRDNPPLHAISMLELSCFIGERLLRDTDCASMAVSLETRVPLLDHQVVEAAAAIDPTRRFKPLGRKQLLREIALDDLDLGLFERPKSGFVLPFARWCREALRHQIDDVFNDRRLCETAGLNQSAVAKLWRSFQDGAPGVYWSRVWALFVLLWWCRRHGVAR